MLTAITLARSGEPGLAARDLVFGASLIAMLAARVIDFAWLGGWDSDGKPATKAGVQRWVPPGPHAPRRDWRPWWH